ncbi:O-antigen ligase C-terminal domain-containing protein [Undibacterium sp. LX40W]|uniref:O-antigen ligase C-terminal domain-containing protein n=2 Tax=Undibacterium TaxID=401469 RepID=A0A923HQF1_9BURK|nr:O-antigen ligase family protein [Undibacterium nitidum]MBC3881375.1 O-antigen ligase C-terminal domain-containing protein [Undibacterium nitidum]MBC3891842.1 O-antigen ligase C-terminal domain-containing protein [Undibacterium sp. LX40W]
MYLNQTQEQLARQQQVQAQYSLPLLLLCLALNIPFFLPWHTLPFTSFCSELAAYILGMTAVLGMMISHSSMPTISLPRNILAPVFFVLLVLLQWSSGYFAYASNAILMLMCGAFLCLLMLVGATLKKACGIQVLMTKIAQSVLIGSVLCALIGFVQALGYAKVFAGLIANPMIASGVYGNIAQQNHYATYLAFGLASMSYLSLTNKISLRTTLLALTTLLVGLFLSASRSAYIYAAMMVLILSWHRFSSLVRTRWSVRSLYLILGLIIFLIVFVGLVSQGSALPQLKRLTNLSESLGARAFLWRHSLEMAQESPLLGVGFDAFAWRLTEQIGTGSLPNMWGVDQYAHNIFLQLLATLGVVGLFLICSPILASIPWRSWRQSSTSRFFIAMLLGILLIHSLLEQPLYFTYFSIYAALLLSFVDDQPWTICWGQVQSTLIGMAAIFLLSIAAYWGYQYKQFETIFNQASANELRSDTTAERLRELHQLWVLQPLIEGYAPELFVAHDGPVQEKLKLNQRLIRFAPLPENMYRQAALLAEKGQTEAAKYQVRKAILVYPDMARLYLERYRFLATENPELYAELAMFTEQEIDLYLNK